MRFRAPARKFLETVLFCFCVIGAWVVSPAQTASAPESGNTGATYRIAGTIVNKLDGNPLGPPNPLQFNGASHGVHNTGKFSQEAIARALYDAPAVLPDLRLHQLAEMHL